jgi:hypothetical protein
MKLIYMIQTLIAILVPIALAVSAAKTSLLLALIVLPISWVAIQVILIAFNTGMGYTDSLAKARDEVFPP